MLTEISSILGAHFKCTLKGDLKAFSWVNGATCPAFRFEVQFRCWVDSGEVHVALRTAPASAPVLLKEGCPLRIQSVLVLHVSVHRRVAQVGFFADLALEVTPTGFIARSALAVVRTKLTLVACIRTICKSLFHFISVFPFFIHNKSFY